jgi:hypothetical protein
MKKIVFLFTIAALAFCSCGKTPAQEPELEYPELGEEFQSLGEKIDLSQQNKFDESLFYGSWVQDKSGHDNYVDGELVESFREPDEDRTLEYVFDRDHTMTIVSDEPTGHYVFPCNWLYVHNFLMLHFQDNDQQYYCYDVVDIKSGVLQLRCPVPYWEDALVRDYYFPDMNGYRTYHVFEFTAK